MSTGNVLYLLMCIGAFTGFAIVLAIESWHQSKQGPDMVGSASEDEQHHGQAAHA